MNLLPQLPVNRRGFFTAAARAAALLALAAFAGGQEIKRRRLANDPNCLKLTTCSECTEFGRCTKPKAQDARSLRSSL